MPYKSDAEAIHEHMLGLPSKLRLDKARRWWPKWLFRSDHVENVADVLNSGRLLSREIAESNGLIKKDSAGSQFIVELTPPLKRYVRLYFRPRTPTQYANEGIRPESMIQYGAHMPVPIYLLFSVRLLKEDGVLFSNGRLTADAEIGGTFEFLKSINFGHVYHDSGVGPLGSTRRSEILNARHSEVLVLDELCLDHLKYVICRSEPEQDTLLNP